MSPRGRRNRQEETAEEAHTEPGSEVEETAEEAEAAPVTGQGSSCSYCKAPSRPTADGKHKCQCRREKR